MSTDASAHADSDVGDFDELQLEREQLAGIIDIGIEQCLYKIGDPDRDRHNGRIADPKREQARAKWVNSLAKLVREKRMLLRDRELDELAEEVEELKELQEGPR